MVRRGFAACMALLVGVLAVVVTASPAFADEIRDKQWYLNDLGFRQAHKLSQGEGVTVGMIDTGVDASHPDLKNNVEAGKGYGEGAEDGLKDKRSHGTGVASVLAGHGHGDSGAEGVLGIAPKANIISVGVHWDEEKSKSQSSRIAADIAEAIEWLVDDGADVISVSMGSGGDSAPIEYARKHGVPVVASAGNVKSSEADALPGNEVGTHWPGSASDAIPVTGTAPDGDFWDGSLTLEGASVQPKYGIAAPGEDIPVAESGGGYAPNNQGTSYAAPIVSGTLALIKSAYPDLDHQTLIARLLETADDKGDEGYDEKFGHGIVNPVKALTEDVKVDDGYTKLESKASERLPLDKQGKQDSAGGSVGTGANDSSDTMTFVVTAASIAVAVLVLAALITVPILQSRRKP